MKMMIFKRWGPDALKRPDPFKWALSIEKAQAMFERGDTVQAVYFIDDQPYARVSMRKDYFRVSFFDEKAVIFLVYDFKLVDERLFLCTAIFYTLDEADLRTSMSQYDFEPDGTEIIRIWDHVQNTVSTSVPCKIDVSGLWEDYPKFGDYMALLKFERDLRH